MAERAPALAAVITRRSDREPPMRRADIPTDFYRDKRQQEIATALDIAKNQASASVTDSPEEGMGTPPGEQEVKQ